MCAAYYRLVLRFSVTATHPRKGCLNGSIPLNVGQASLKYRVRLPGANSDKSRYACCHYPYWLAAHQSEVGVRPTIKMFILMVWYDRISMPEDCRPRDAEQHGPLRYAEYQRQYGIILGDEAILKHLYFPKLLSTGSS